MSNENSKRPELFVDHERFNWSKSTITGAEIRELASLPDDVEIYWKSPGNPDFPVGNITVIDLTVQPGPDHFSTQSVGSQAGA